MKLAIASGKGGTGKTTVSVNLYYFLNKILDNTVQLVDCDVEEPNDALFFKDGEKRSEKTVNQLIPEIDVDKCTFCKKCSDWCEFNAITIVKNLGFAEINTDLCHSCGACSVACTFGAITEFPVPLGSISEFNTGFGRGLTEGRLRIGSSMQTSLIKEVKKEAAPDAGLVIIDAPPGTSCPVVETVADADFILLVTEPTPFGLHDLEITVELLEDLKKPFGVIVNKAGLGFQEIYHFLRNKNIEILGEIPFQKDYAAQYASGDILKNIPEELEQIYAGIVQTLIEKLQLK